MYPRIASTLSVLALLLAITAPSAGGFAPSFGGAAVTHADSSGGAGSDVADVGTTVPAYGSIESIVNETGHVTLSVDGLGENTGSGTIRVQKPVGATVRKAFMAAASTGFSGYKIPDGQITIDGQPVAWGLSTPSSIFSWNHWADVTPLVKSKA